MRGIVFRDETGASVRLRDDEVSEAEQLRRELALVKMRLQETEYALRSAKATPTFGHPGYVVLGVDYGNTSGTSANYGTYFTYTINGTIATNSW